MTEVSKDDSITALIAKLKSDVQYWFEIGILELEGAEDFNAESTADKFIDNLVVNQPEFIEKALFLTHRKQMNALGFYKFYVDYHMSKAFHSKGAQGFLKDNDDDQDLEETVEVNSMFVDKVQELFGKRKHQEELDDDHDDQDDVCNANWDYYDQHCTCSKKELSKSLVEVKTEECEYQQLVEKPVGNTEGNVDCAEERTRENVEDVDCAEERTRARDVEKVDEVELENEKKLEDKFHCEELMAKLEDLGLEDIE